MKDEEYVVRGVPQLNLTDESITVQTEVEEVRHGSNLSVGT